MVIAAIVVTCILILLCGTGCCAQREMLRAQHDTLYIEHSRVDSVYRRDSVLVREKGDTIYIYKERVREKYRVVHDTIRLALVDTFAVERVIEVEKPQPLTRWEEARIRAFWGLVAGLAACLLWIFRKPILKLIKV